jgi:hypothetical protein
MQVGVSVAGMLTCLPLSQLSVVDIQPDYIFAALFDIHGSKHAAEFCTSRVLEVCLLSPPPQHKRLWNLNQLKR